MQIYLAGYENETEYRREAKELYSDKIKLFDPMSEVEWEILEKKKNGIDLSSDDIIKIVEEDKDAIRNSTALVAYVKQFTAGTMMEILYAYEYGIPVYLIDPDNKLFKNVWLCYHVDEFFKDIKSCFDHILIKYNN